MDIKPLIDQIRQYILDGYLKKALQQLRIILNDSPFLNEVLLQTYRYQDVIRQIRTGTIDQAAAMVIKNQITSGILQLLTEIEEQIEKPEIHSELVRSFKIIEGQNIITSSNINTGGGDFIVGNQTNIYNDMQIKYPRILTDHPRVDPRDIIGRQEDIRKIYHLLHNQKRPVVIQAMAGIGKTTIAAAYLRQYTDEYQHIAWITQTDQGILVDLIQCNSLLKSLSIETKGQEPDIIIATVLAELNLLENRPKLLVIDNATREIEKHLNQLPGQPDWHLLLTSRHIISRMTLFQLGFLSENEAIALFQKYCSHISDPESIVAIVRAVEYHTLTVEILAKTAQKQRSKVEALLKALDIDLRANVSIQHSTQQSINSVTSYLTTIFDFAQLTLDEKWLLRQFTCLPAGFFEYDFLFKIIKPTETNRSSTFSENLEELVQKGWLIHDAKMYKMHQIVKSVSILKIPPKEADVLPLITSIANLLFFDLGSDNNVEAFQWIPYGETILELFWRSNSDTICLLQNDLASALQLVGRYEKAKNLLEKTAASYEANYGCDHPNTATTQSNLAKVLIQLGEYNTAKTLLEKSIASNKENLGEKHPTLATSYTNLAIVLQELGEYDEAQVLLEDAVAINEAEFGKSHPTTALTYSSLAMLFRHLGKYGEAKSLLERALSIKEAKLGNSHPTTVTTLSNLAMVLRQMKDYETAKNLLEKVKAHYKEVFGETHPYIAATNANLATVMIYLNDNLEAKKLIEKALQINEIYFDSNHPTTTTMRSTYAEILHLLGENESASKILTEVIQVSETNFGEVHPVTAGHYLTLAEVLRDFDQYNEALYYAQKGLNIFQQTLPAEHQYIEIAKSILASIQNTK